MTKFVEENDDRQYKEKWHNVANQTASECAQTSHNSVPVIVTSAPISGHAVCLSSVGCLCGNFGQEVLGKTSCTMVNGHGRIDTGRFSQQIAPCSSIEGSLDRRGNCSEPDMPGNEFRNRHFVRRIKHSRRCAASFHRSARE